MTPAQTPRTRKRGARTPDDRFATWLRRLRWPVVIVWILAVVLLHGLSSSLSKATNDGASAYLPASAASTKVVLLQQAAARAALHAGGQPETNTAIAVFASSGPLTATDVAAIGSARTAVAGLAGHVAGLAAPSALLPSGDRRAAVFSVNISGQATNTGSVDRDAVRAIRAAIAKPVAAAGTGLVAAVTGSAAVNADTSAGNQQTKLLLTALIIVAVILLLVYRSPILWLLPLFGAIAAIVIAQASAHGLANAGLTVSTLSADILIVLVFGAASDYALLLVHRYREELRHHAMTEAAMATALRATLPTLVASAGTVTCAMLCLLAADSASLHGLGPVGAVGIVSALLAQTTFLPALLLVTGRGAFWPRTPRFGASGREESRIWAGIGSQVARRPGCDRCHRARPARRGVRRPGVAEHRQQPDRQHQGQPGQRGRRAAAHRALPGGREQPARAARPARPGGCCRRGGTRDARRRCRDARLAGRGIRQLLGDLVGEPVRFGGDLSDRGPAAAAVR